MIVDDSGRSSKRAAAMADWNPELYSRFEAERNRPARDLLDRVVIARARSIVDLGCGPGNSTELLAARYPGARVLGLDSSPAMVEAARKRLPHLQFDQADLATWQPDEAPDLIFANAVLQWVPDHATLLPRLFGLLDHGGALAIQMPDNLAEPSHRLMRELASEEPWAERLSTLSHVRTPLPPLAAYYDMLASQAASVDVWRTTYQHPMRSPAAIVDWLRATGLRPFLGGLPAEDQARFLNQFEARLDVLYAKLSDGCRLLAFPRMFLVARKRSADQ